MRKNFIATDQFMIYSFPPFETSLQINLLAAQFTDLTICLCNTGTKAQIVPHSNLRK